MNLSILLFLQLFFLLLDAAAKLSLVVLAIVAYKFARRYIPYGPSFASRLKAAWKAF